MTNLLSWFFWFNLRPPSLLPIFNNIFIAWLLILLLIAVLSIYFKKKKKIYKSFWKNLYNLSATNLIIGLFLFFFNYQQAPFLSARFWLIIWGLIIIIWLFFIIKNLKKIPKKRKEIEAEKEFNKYLP
jgi:uncharacterized membrane protein SirB2